MGYAVGWAVFKASGYGEEASCWAAGIISFVYALSGVIFINFVAYAVMGFPNIYGIVFGILAIGWAAERGYRTPETLAVNTHV